jgi:hypothetical protein
MQPADLEPLVIDKFANAIGVVTNKQAQAFTYFWLSIANATTAYRSRYDKETTELKKRLLDINPEGKLFLEIKDILDELNIITRVKQQQEKVVKDFLKHVKQNQEWADDSFESRTKMQADGFKTHIEKIQGGADSTKSPTQRHAEDLLESFITHRAELDHLTESATRTSEAVIKFNPC